MTTILVIIALFAGVLLWQKMMSASSKAVNQKVLRRGSHERGQNAVHTALTFTCPSQPASQVTDVVRDSLALPTSKSGITHKAYMAEQGPTWLKIGIGSSLTRGSEMIFSAEDQGSGSTGLLAVRSWQESDGIVTTISEIEAIQATVRQALRSLDAGVQIAQETV
jgi:hypothetical protein